MPAAPSLDALRASLHQAHDPAYLAKQMHPVPLAPVVDRQKFLLDSAEGKIILDIGASGPLHQALLTVSPKVYGLDRTGGKGVVACDFDAYASTIPTYPDVQLLICGEVVEHLSNPGWFLDRLRLAYPQTRLIVTAPNAFNSQGRPYLAKGTENVNIEHVAWYSYTTLATLLKRHGWIPEAFAWYRGAPYFAEGLIIVTEGTDAAVPASPHPSPPSQPS